MSNGLVIGRLQPKNILQLTPEGGAEARTIADLAGSEEIQLVHLADMLQASRSAEVDVKLIQQFPILNILLGQLSMFQMYP